MTNGYFQDKWDQDYIRLSMALSNLNFSHYESYKDILFLLTGLKDENRYYYCLTGIEEKILHGKMGIGYEESGNMYRDHLIPEIRKLLAAWGFCGTAFVNFDDTKLVGVIFQSLPGKEKTDAVGLARRIQQTVQAQYERFFGKRLQKYRSTTALAGPLSGAAALYEGAVGAKSLKRTYFFFSPDEVLTAQYLDSIRNGADYRVVMGSCRRAGALLARGDWKNCRKQAKQLFLMTLKYSFRMELVEDALSYWKGVLDVRLTVYGLQDRWNPEELCRAERYLTIEDCYRAMEPVLETLGRTIAEGRAYSDTVAYAICYMKNHLAGDVPIREVAEYADAVPTYLSKVFREQTGMTVKQYQTKFRVDEAARRLAQTDEKINVIARECGFLERKYFTEHFRRLMGITPREYRRRMQDGEGK